MREMSMKTQHQISLKPEESQIQQKTATIIFLGKLKVKEHASPFCSALNSMYLIFGEYIFSVLEIPLKMKGIEKRYLKYLTSNFS